MNIANEMNLGDTFWGEQIVPKLEDGLLSPEEIGESTSKNSLPLPLPAKILSANSSSLKYQPFNFSNDELSQCVPVHVPTILPTNGWLQTPDDSPEVRGFTDLELIRKSIESLDTAPSLPSILPAPQAFGGRRFHPRSARSSHYSYNQEDSPYQQSSWNDDDDSSGEYTPPVEYASSRARAAHHLVATFKATESEAPKTGVQYSKRTTQVRRYVSQDPYARIKKQNVKSSYSEQGVTIQLPLPAYTQATQAQGGTFMFLNLRKKGAWSRKK